MSTFQAYANAEWIKLRTVRSTLYTLAVSAFVSIGIGAIVCQQLAADLSNGKPPVGPDATGEHLDGISRSLIGGAAAQLAIAALGVLIVTSEFTTGMIRASLTAMPQRRLWITAKLAVFGALALVVGQVLTFSSFGIGQAILSTQHGGASLSDPHVLSAVVATGLYISLAGLLGAVVGLLVRHTAGAISTILGLLFVIPIFAGALPVKTQHAVLRFLPNTIGEQASTAHQLDFHFTAWGGIGLMVGYVMVLTVAGIWMLQHRDA